MKNNFGLKRFYPALAVLILLGGVKVSAELAPVKDRIVVIVSLDGMGAVYLNDPKAEMPVIRKLAAEGAMAERMRPSLPTVTWPNHTTLVTGVQPGKHGVIANSYWDREKGKTFALLPDPIFNKDEIVKVPTLYDVAHDAGLKTAAIVWPASRGAKTLDWTFPDVQTDEVFQKYATPSFMEECRTAGIPFEKQETFCKNHGGEQRDVMYTQMLNYIIEHHRPQLALLHLVDIDHVEHLHGPQSAEAYHAVHFEDERVGEIRATLEKNFPGRATLIVTSDHGFAAYRQVIQPNVKLRQEGLLKVENGKIKDRIVFGHDQGGACFIYVLDKTNRAALIKRVVKMFTGLEGIDQVIVSAEDKKFGLVSPDEDPRMGDVLLTAKNGYSFSNAAEGDVLVTRPSDKILGAHGHSPLLPELQASFVAWGAGIKHGAKLKQIQNLDVTPTAAALLGLKMKTDGNVLEGVLDK